VRPLLNVRGARGTGPRRNHAISRLSTQVSVAHAQQAVKGAALSNCALPLNREQEMDLYKHYRRSTYRANSCG
jgi:hypothetical protein